MQWQASSGVPDYGGLSLVGDSNGSEFGERFALVFEYGGSFGHAFINGLFGTLPDG